MTATDAWNVQQYERFKRERRQPFDDLRAGLLEVPGGRAVDLGCGTGELSRELADQLQVSDLVGVDSSPAMLAEAARHARPGVRFVAGDLATFTPEAPLDVVFANASLQWAADHRAVLARWVSFLRPGGQLAVQVPANADQATHTVADEVARGPKFAPLFGSAGPPADPIAANVLPPEDYARCLHQLGLVDLVVQLRVYPHLLGASADVVEWVKGTTLTRFRARLAPPDYQRFEDEYRARLLAVIGMASPYFFPFKRILFWARRS